jgi:hypothetical protein
MLKKFKFSWRYSRTFQVVVYRQIGTIKKFLCQFNFLIIPQKEQCCDFIHPDFKCNIVILLLLPEIFSLIYDAEQKQKSNLKIIEPWILVSDLYVNWKTFSMTCTFYSTCDKQSFHRQLVKRTHWLTFYSNLNSSFHVLAFCELSYLKI